MLTKAKDEQHGVKNGMHVHSAAVDSYDRVNEKL